MAPPHPSCGATSCGHTPRCSAATEAVPKLLQFEVLEQAVQLEFLVRSELYFLAGILPGPQCTPYQCYLLKHANISRGSALPQTRWRKSNLGWRAVQRNADAREVLQTSRDDALPGILAFRLQPSALHEILRRRVPAYLELPEARSLLAGGIKIFSACSPKKGF